MSAEAPKEAGTTAPVTPQKPEGGFSRFLRKLFEVPSESHQTQQPLPMVVQPPPGLEDFTAKIQQGVDEVLSAQKQLELDRQKAETDRLAREAAQELLIEQLQKDWVDRGTQEIIRREDAIAEADKILKDFRIEERLQVIRATVWEGKGEIKPIKPVFDQAPDADVEKRVKVYGGVGKSDRLGGFELAYQYPFYEKVYGYIKRKVEFKTKGIDVVPLSIVGGGFGVIEEGGSGCGDYYWKYRPCTEAILLSISIWNLCEDPTNSQTVLRVSGTTLGSKLRNPHYLFFEGAIIPVENDDSKTLLEEALVNESKKRFFPSELKKQSADLAKKQNDFGWNSWVHEVPDNYASN